jgi:hypothetical protein
LQQLHECLALLDRHVVLDQPPIDAEWALSSTRCRFQIVRFFKVDGFDSRHPEHDDAPAGQCHAQHCWISIRKPKIRAGGYVV